MTREQYEAADNRAEVSNRILHERRRRAIVEALELSHWRTNHRASPEAGAALTARLGAFDEWRAGRSRRNRRFSGAFVGAGVIPIGPRIARQFVPVGADLRRFNAGTHPLLLDHATRYRAQHGRVISAAVENDGISGEIEVFGYDEDTLPALAAEREWVHQLLDDGARNLSVGMRLYESEWIETDMGDVIRTTKWEPDEMSLVAVGASRPARLQEES